jgi:glycosyltransferase involved in cell wall biosynthesis
VTIPCFDEENTVGEVVRGVPREIDGIAQVDILVLDDGSSDSTAEAARQAGAEVLRHPENLGLGRTFRDGVQRALERGTDVLVNIDGDGQFDPADIPKLVGPVLAAEAHLATASRFLRPDLVPRMPAIKRWGNRWVAWIVWLITGKRFRDVSCGFRAFSREALLRMNLFGSFTYTQETFIDLLFKGLGIVEVPVKVEGVRKFGGSRIAASIPRYALRSFKIMFRAAIGYHPFRFFAGLAVIFLAVGGGLLAFLLSHYLRNGAFSPHIWAGFVGGSFTFLGILTLVIGFVGDILVRIRLNQEETLYYLKRSSFAGPQKTARTDAKRGL